ncbi:SGNH/GDSL hydrolase family protein [Brucepastera parasyntrophica]|uniref:SGNH/GDSL hydrolase family protein n=1 Tax=Brucepastera parasyntrophica TaxID=2880008 RepID=UPI002108BDEB|nr:SGNH/GDSL hydrolase family protein [Brucepastera parasyntrophica]ULQ58679.1 SGNH/GDSL hydrolase family protein [Brucepastera parasyntrophica]
MNIRNRHISIWGDSILKGVVLDDATTRYCVLENNCVSRFAQETGASISNHACFGMTTGKAYERIRKSIERNPPSKDDIVLIEYGGNDCDYKWSEIAENPEAHHEPKTPIHRFIGQLQGIIDIFKSFSISPILMSLPPLEPFRYFEWLSRGLNKENIMKWLNDINKIYRWQEAYNDIVTDTAIKNDLRLINVRRNFLVSDHYTSKICSDGIHPNQAGHESIFNSCLSYLQSV